MQWQLNQLIGRAKDKVDGGVGYRDISEATGLSTSTLYYISKNTAKRADLDTIEGLLDYFSGVLEEEITISDLLKRVK